MVERLTPLDATFLELEQADQSAHMHIGGVLIFEPRPGDGVPGFAEICERLEPRLRELLHFTDRLSEPEVKGLTWPQWIPDERFNLRGHVQHVTLPSPGDEDELREWAGEFYSQRLDRTRPLWEMAVIDGLADGRWAIATKTHHALVDGVGSIDLAHVLLDAEPEPDAGTEPDRVPVEGNGRPAREQRGRDVDVAEDDEREPDSTLESAAKLATTPLRLAGRAVDAALHPDKAKDAVRRARAALKMIVEDELIAAPKSSVNVPISGKRRLAVLEADLDELRAIKRQLGGTVNDVVLASMAGGLRRLLLSRNEHPPQSGLRAMVPVNVRQASETLKLGNKITSLFVHLPVAADDVAERYAAQLEEAEGLKASDQALGSQTVVDLASLAPPAIHSFLAQSLFATRLFNVTITNVPGPQVPLYSMGSRMLEVWPLVPLAAEHALGLAVLSYNGKLFFCINADRDSTPDLNVLREGIEAEIKALGELARAKRPNGSEQPVFGGVHPGHNVEVHEVKAG